MEGERPPLCAFLCPYVLLQEAALHCIDFELPEWPLFGVSYDGMHCNGLPQGGLPGCKLLAPIGEAMRGTTMNTAGKHNSQKPAPFAQKSIIGSMNNCGMGLRSSERWTGVGHMSR